MQKKRTKFQIIIFNLKSSSNQREKDNSKKNKMKYKNTTEQVTKCK